MRNMHEGAEDFSNLFTQPIRAGIREALRLTPPHLVPQITADSLSPWIQVNSIPGPHFAIWRETGDVYVVKENGAVDEEPINRKSHNDPDPPPEGYVWGCEDCANENRLWITSDTRYANFHSDAHGHSLAL